MKPTKGSLSEVALKADLFASRFPGDPRVAEANAIAILAALRADGLNGKLGATASRQAARAFADDKTNPAELRFDVRAATKESELAEAGDGLRMLATRRTTPEIRSNLRIAHARELAAEFPADARAYGYMLSVAKSSSGATAVELANEILNSRAPERIKAGAERVLSQQRLVDRRISGEFIDLSGFEGKFVVVYTWTSSRPDIFTQVPIWISLGDVACVGINLDADPQIGRRLVESARIPGSQIYGTGGLDGPLARGLGFTSENSIYLIDRKGILVDANGALGTVPKLKQMLGLQEVAK